MNLPNTPGPAPGEISPGGRVSWMTGVAPLGDPSRHNDFPSAAAAPNGDIWTVWASYSGLREELHVRRYRGRTWYSAFPIPGASGDVWMPQVAVGADGKPWFVWSQLNDYPNHDPEHPNWDLYAARMDGDRWTGPVRLTDSPQPDINHHVIADAQGTIWVAWQGFRDGQSDIFLRSYRQGAWSAPLQVTSDPADDWSPSLAADSAGNVTVVWDSYRSGNYDVYMRTLRNGVFGPETPVAASASGERNASAVYDRQDRLWVAFEDVGVNWAKDVGGRGFKLKQSGTNIGAEREVRIKVWENGKWMQPAHDVTTSLGTVDSKTMQAPRLYCDPQGRVWLLFRRRTTQTGTWTWAVDSDTIPNASGPRSYWSTFATFYDGDAWLPASELPRSRDRISSTMAAAPAPNGQTWVFWHTDERQDEALHIPREDQVWSCVLTPARPPKPYQFAPALEPKHSGIELTPQSEAEDVRVLRSQTVTIAGKTNHLFKGDLHRHTELSTDGGGRMDGSILDFFRYMIDAASMDYGAITDHSAGGDYEYWWWLIQKVTDLHHAPGRYLSLFGYERTPHWPKGHKNIISAARNVPVVRLFFRPDIAEHWSTYATIAGDLVDDDTVRLFDAVRETGGIAIPHTLATSQGNDWRDTDEQVQPVAEIYQGARTAYEHEGAPGSHKPKPGVTNDPDYNPQGFIWKAWEKGVRIGTIASSDHGSTHVSFAFVYSDSPTRAGMIDAIRKRKTYGATDNLLLEFWAGDHFMGEEFSTGKLPEFRVKARGTAPVSAVSIIRSGTYVLRTAPNQQQVSLSYRDASPLHGASYYYVRIEQTDGNTAWSSPIWVKLP